MQTSLRRWIATAVLLVLSGCAAGPALPPSAQMTYLTNPDGAMLFEAGKAIGEAPVTRQHVAAGDATSVRTPLVTAVWPSGAKESFYAIVPPGSDREATIQRPANAPGLEVDLAHAKTLALKRAQQDSRDKETMLREQRQNSARCREQRAGNSKAVQDDC